VKDLLSRKENSNRGITNLASVVKKGSKTKGERGPKKLKKGFLKKGEVK